MGLFDDVQTGKQTTTQRSSSTRSSGLFSDVQGSGTPNSFSSPEQTEKPASIGSFLGNLVKEVALAIPRALATPFATFYQDTTALRTGVRPESVNVPILGEIGVSNDPKKALGQLGERAIDIGTFAVGGSAVKSLTKGAVKQASKYLLIDSTIGAGTGFAIGLQQEQKGAELAKSTAAGAAFGALLPPLMGLGFKGTSLIVKKSIKEVASSKMATVEFLEEFVKKNQKSIDSVYDEGSPARIKTVYDKFAADTATKESTQVALAKTAIAGMELMSNLAQRARVGVFREAPIAFIQATQKLKDNLARLGIDVNMTETVQRTEARATTRGIEKRDRYVKETLGTFGSEIWIATKKYLAGLDDLSRIQSGQKTSSGLSEAEAIRGMYELRIKYRDAGILESVKTATMTHQRHMNELLDDAVTLGRITDEDRLRIKEAHPNYIPHRVVDFMDPDATDAFAKSSGAKNLQLKGAKGSERAIEDIDHAVYRVIFQEGYVNEIQRGMNAFFGGIKGIEKNFDVTGLITKEGIEKNQKLIARIGGASGEINTLAEAVYKLKRIDKPTQSTITKLTQEMVELMDTAATYGARQMEENVGLVTKIKSLLARIDTRRTKLSELQTKSSLTVGFKKSLEADIEHVQSLKKKIRELQKEAGADIAKVKTVDLPKGTQRVIRMNEGVREEWAVPTDIARALSRTSSPAIERIQNVLSNTFIGKAVFTGPARAVRSVATTFSPAFLLKNPVRDVQSAFLFARFSTKDLIEGFSSAFWGNVKDTKVLGRFASDERIALHRQATEAGLLYKSAVREKNIEQAYHEALRDGGILGKTLPQKIMAPLELIEAAGTVMEQTTRLAVFRNSLRSGKAVQEAVTDAANATVDFGRKGDISETINMVVPFFNAAVQGTLTLGRKVMEDPMDFGRKAYYSATLPAMLTYAWNRQFESYQNIPDWEKDSFWIIQVSETNGYDLKGSPTKIPHYVRIPKGIPQQIFAAPTERFLSVGDAQYPRETDEFLKDMVSIISPINWSEGLVGGPTRMITPTAIALSWETMSNYDAYTGSDIVPEWVKKPWGWVKSEELEPEERFSDAKTSEVAEMLGQALNLSPAQIDHIVNFGLIKDMNTLLDIGLETEQDKIEETQSRFGREPNAIESLSKTPVLRTFFGSSSYGKYYKERELELKKAQERNQLFSELFK